MGRVADRLRATAVPKLDGTAWARPLAAPGSPASWFSVSLRLPWCGPPSPTTSPSNTSALIATLLSIPHYKFAALWSGQEGSLLLWAFLLSAYGFVLRVRHRVDVRLCAFASVIMAAIQIFFLLLLTVAATPFSIAPSRSRPTARG